MKIILIGSAKELVKAAIAIFKVVLSVPLFMRLFICKNWIAPQNQRIHKILCYFPYLCADKAKSRVAEIIK